MKIVIKDAKCGLKKGEIYDLCDMSAKTLIAKGQAEKYENKSLPPVESKDISPMPKVKRPRKRAKK